MLDNGASVSIWDRDQALLDGLAARNDSHIQLLNVDIGQQASVEAAVAATMARFGKIDILINNAAIVGPNTTTWEYPVRDFIGVVHVGLIGAFLVYRAVGTHMIAGKYGRIVNVASIAGKKAIRARRLIHR